MVGLYHPLLDVVPVDDRALKTASHVNFLDQSNLFRLETSSIAPLVPTAIQMTEFVLAASIYFCYNS